MPLQRLLQRLRRHLRPRRLLPHLAPAPRREALDPMLPRRRSGRRLQLLLRPVRLGRRARLGAVARPSRHLARQRALAVALVHRRPLAALAAALASRARSVAVARPSRHLARQRVLGVALVHRRPLAALVHRRPLAALVHRRPLAASVHRRQVHRRQGRRPQASVAALPHRRPPAASRILPARLQQAVAFRALAAALPHRRPPAASQLLPARAQQAVALALRPRVHRRQGRRPQASAASAAHPQPAASAAHPQPAA